MPCHYCHLSNHFYKTNFKPPLLDFPFVTTPSCKPPLYHGHQPFFHTCAVVIHIYTFNLSKVCCLIIFHEKLMKSWSFYTHHHQLLSTSFVFIFHTNNAYSFQRTLWTTNHMNSVNSCISLKRKNAISASTGPWLSGDLCH